MLLSTNQGRDLIDFQDRISLALITNDSHGNGIRWMRMSIIIELMKYNYGHCVFQYDGSNSDNIVESINWVPVYYKLINNSYINRI